ncbi:putative Ig domain-containing protein [Luteolibacter sp. SL250]|uniref:putative Ig domain-containing protein n=1 Tax=Luteolibacter sp. SL250 TaxID=2995170 RepID=UPI002270DD31|nr:putative Ig domain-containing protein [Luteolibacter sp. SL250]WAC19104.1 putative Ig domain-containing protein [Luteolibacter sp. SL250]
MHLPIIRTFARLSRSMVVLSVLGATASGQDGKRHPTPEECPAFSKPAFISQPPARAYPGALFDMRPAVTGGTWPYRFSLKAAPAGMTIDGRTGTIRWQAPKSTGEARITIALADQAGRTAEQDFTVKVGEEGFHFVSPTGDDTNPGTFAKPWKTLIRAAQPVADPAHTTLYLRGGTHLVEKPATPGKNDLNVLKISDTSPRRWIAWPGEKPVIDLGWTEEKWKHALGELVAQADADPARKDLEPRKKYSRATTISMGHRIYIADGTDHLTFDGLEIRNANYYMFVMWNGRLRGLTWRRCNLHHLYADGGENPGFIFGYAAARKYERTPGMEKASPEAANPFGRRPQAEPYLNTVIQECTFSDRRYDTRFQSGHGGGIIWYTTQGSLIEDNRFNPMDHGVTISDKDNGWENTYRNNVFKGDFNISAQGTADAIDIHHNFFDGNVTIGKQPGWLRNIWFHHNSVRGALQMMGGGTFGPDQIDPAGRPLDGPADPEVQTLVRNHPITERLVFAWNNVLALPEKPHGETGTYTSRVPSGPAFANRFRFVWCDRNLVDEGARIKAGYTKTEMDWGGLRACGIDVNGARARITLDAEGRLPADSPWRGTHGRDAGTLPVKR